MRYLAEGPTQSQPTFPTGRTLVFVLCQLETGVRLVISLLLAMGAHCWVPLPLGCLLPSHCLSKLISCWRYLFSFVKKLTKENKDLQREINLLKQWDGSRATQGKMDPTMCPHCNKEGYHEPDACFELAKNKDKRPPGWKSGL